MGTVSAVWPFLIHLKDSETEEFFKEIQNATLADSNYEIAEKIDYIVVNARKVAEERERAENERFRRSLIDDALRATDRAKKAEEAAERADLREQKAKAEKQELEDKLDSLRALLSRRNEQCLMVEPDEVFKCIGVWGQ